MSFKYLWQNLFLRHYSAFSNRSSDSFAIVSEKITLLLGIFLPLPQAIMERQKTFFYGQKPIFGVPKNIS
jgi:hypothetical protein